MKIFLPKLTLLTTVLLLMAAYSSEQGVPAAVHYIPHDQVAAVMAKGGPIVNDPGLIVLANRREAGPAELHEHTNHIFIIVEGEGTFITGGALVGAKQTGPGETRAPPLKAARPTISARGTSSRFPPRCRTGGRKSPPRPSVTMQLTSKVNKRISGSRQSSIMSST